jgi:hypothetical protein
MAGIIARLPQSFVFEFQKLFGDNQLPLLFFIELAFFFVIVMATILVIQGVRRIPIQFAKRMVGRTGGSLPECQRPRLPAAESQFCRGNADYFCPGTNVPAGHGISVLSGIGHRQAVVSHAFQ